MRKIVSWGGLPHRKSEEGFTLIELAIVMVIIGLLVGGVLRGQEMIQNARVSNLINSFDGYVSSVAIYMDTYKAIPGDDANAVARWTTTGNAGLTAGTGDGIIQGAYNDSGGTSTAESRQFWQHLRVAGLVAGTTTDSRQPANPFGGIFGVQDSAFGAGHFTGPVICATNIDGLQAQKVDAKMDDGNPTTGVIRASNADAGVITAISTTTTYAGGTNYTLCRRL